MLLRDRPWKELSPDPAVLAAHPLFAPLRAAEIESCLVAYLASDWTLLGTRQVTGARSWVDVSIRTVAADALALDATRVVMAHNHPGGDPEPSRGDLSFTRRLEQGLDALGVRLFDHLVLTADGMTSLRAAGLL